MTGRAGSQTLDRGLRILEVLAEAPSPMTTSELGRALGLNRVIVDRLLVTLLAHRLIVRDANLRYSVGPGIHRLLSAGTSSVLEIASPFLAELAQECQATAHLAQAEAEMVVVLETVEPKRSKSHIAYRSGTTHSIERGSSGVSILAARPPRPDDPPAVKNARSRGYAISVGEVLSPNTIGVSVGLGLPPPLPELSIGVTIFAEDEVPAVAEAVARTGTELASELRDLLPRGTGRGH